MFWTFPLKVPTFDTTTNAVDHVTIYSQEEFTKLIVSQFKTPGEYNLKNTNRWQDAGNGYTSTITRPNFEGGYYVKAVRKTHKWKTYWNAEKEKVKNGIFIDGLYIPPFYYWYLNYCPIYNDIVKKKMLGFVWDSDLWFFQYIMICMLTGKHAVVVKARQRGYSFKIMSLLYWCYSWHEGSINTIGGSKEEYTLKSWRFLEFYRQHINKTTSWKRGPIIAKSLEWYERTPLKDGGYAGLDSKLSATTFKVSPENGVGGSQTIFFYEEAGIAPTLLQTVGFVRPALEHGNKTAGLIIVSGAVGDLDDCKDLKEIFYSPSSHNFLDVDNIWDTKNPTKKCGLFVSEAYNMEGFIDKEGNSLVKEATAWILANNDRVKSTKRKDLAQLDISQKPLSPEEAFAQRKDSEFPADLLRMQQDRIKLKDKENKWAFKPFKCILYENLEGEIKYKTDNLPPEHEYPINPEWDDKRGVVTIYEPPGEPKPYMNFAGVDTVEVDFTETSESIMTVDIYRRAVKVLYTDEKGKTRTRVDGGRIVATYRGRYNPVEKGNEQAWLLIRLYNAFSYVERSKPNFINYMKRNRRAERYLAKETDVPINKDLNVDTSGSNSQYGFIIPSKQDGDQNRSQMWKVLKNSAKEYFASEFDTISNEAGEVTKVITGIDRIDDYWLLEEFIQYNTTGNFDRIISFCAAVTIGNVYENQFGIPTKDETKKEVKEQVRVVKQVSMLGGGGFNSNPRVKRKSLLN